MEDKPTKKPRKPGSGCHPHPENKNKPQNQPGYFKGLVKQAEPDWVDVTVDQTPANPMQNLTIAQMADRINGLDPTRKATRYANFVLAVKRISEGVNTKDVNDMRNRFYQYIALCEACNMKIGNLNAYSAIGIVQQYAWNWKNGGFGSTPERKELIEEIDSVCSGYREQLIADGQINPVTGIFWQKNYDGLRDIQSHEIAPMDPLGEKRSAKEIAEQYKDIIDE